MRIGSWGGRSGLAPAHSRASYLGAYVLGAEVLRLPLVLTTDGKLVVVDPGELVASIVKQRPAGEMSLHDWRALQIGDGFQDSDGAAFAYRASLEPLGLLLDALPDDPWLIFEFIGARELMRSAEALSQLRAAVSHRGLSEQCLLVVEGDDDARAAKEHAPELKLIADLRQLPSQDWMRRVQSTGSVGGLTALAEVLKGGEPTAGLTALEKGSLAGELPLGLIVYASEVPTPHQWSLLSGKSCVWGVLSSRVLELSRLHRPGWPWISESWTGKASDGADVNPDLWHLGYAKYNPDQVCHVYVDGGVHVELRPFQGAVRYVSAGNAVEDEIEGVRERTWEALRDWPFYAGGGVGLVPWIRGDFSAEVDVESAIATQATTVEMAAVNVDAPTHRKPWTQDAIGNRVPNLPSSFRDKYSFFDPHGCPPFVGVEHDEDDGWRINWNLGTDYDGNRYGHAVGNGKLLKGRLRLDRRDAYFAAFYRRAGATADADWICVGVAHNPSLLPHVHLRLAGKRWRQEDASHPTVWMPVVANHFVFREFLLTRHIERAARTRSGQPVAMRRASGGKP